MKHSLPHLLFAGVLLLFLAVGATADDTASEVSASDLASDPLAATVALDAELQQDAEAQATDGACSDSTADATSRVSDYGLPASPLSLLAIQRNELAGSCEMCGVPADCVAFCGSTLVACVRNEPCGDWRYCSCPL